MDAARDTIKAAIEISNQKRKSVKLSEFFWGQNVEDWTEEQIHGKFCYKLQLTLLTKLIVPLNS